MLNKVMLSTESRMRGDMQVRFGGRYGKTYCRKAVRRSVPSLRLGEGGTLLTLVMRLERCDRYAAIRILSNGEIRQAGSTSLSSGIYERPAVGGPSPVVRPATVPALRVLSAAAFCREVRYEVNGRAFFAVGFRNDAEGWELRSDRFKGGSSPKHITTLDNGSDMAMAFEGFIDFLSYLSLKGTRYRRLTASCSTRW